MDKPLVIITGATGNLGRSVAAVLSADYRIVGLDLKAEALTFPVIQALVTRGIAVELSGGMTNS